MNTKKTDAALSAPIDEAALERDAFAEALEAAKTPGDKLVLIYARQARDEARTQTAVMKEQHRLATNHDSAVAERARQADEAHAALSAGRREWSAEVICDHVLSDVRGTPVVQVKLRLEGHRFGPGEQTTVWRGGKPELVDCSGKHAIVQAGFVDWADALEAIRQDVYAPHESAFADLERIADHVGILAMRKALDGVGMEGTPGVKHRFWAECRRPILNKLAGKGPLEDLIASGACRLVDKIHVSDEPPRLVLEL